MKNNRKPEYPVDEIFINRKSARAMSGEAIEHETLMSVFEAARWAPSSWNNQPWRFVYVQRSMPEWDAFYNLLGEFNQVWACKADVLIIVVTKTTFDFNGNPSRTASYDVGTACQNMILQAVSKGLCGVPVEGFDYGAAADMLKLDGEHKVELMWVLGKPGSDEYLPEKNRAREDTYSGRKPLSETVFRGSFKDE